MVLVCSLSYLSGHVGAVSGVGETLGNDADLGDFESREIVVRADFGDLDEERLVTVSLHFMRGPRPPRCGEVVYLLDGRGQGCVGTVEKINGWSARVRPDWATWQGVDPSPEMT